MQLDSQSVEMSRPLRAILYLFTAEGVNEKHL